MPILRITFNAPFEDITVDLNANNPVGIKNTHLLYYYAHCKSLFLQIRVKNIKMCNLFKNIQGDWRVRPLVMIVKEWGRRQGINDASRSTLSSYSLVLMVIHYLQCKLRKIYVLKFFFVVNLIEI